MILKIDRSAFGFHVVTKNGFTISYAEPMGDRGEMLVWETATKEDVDGQSGQRVPAGEDGVWYPPEGFDMVSYVYETVAKW